MKGTPSIGIDFGTSNSSMAWSDPKTGQAEIILNSEGETKTPSMVYFGERETLVGKPVDELIEEVSSDPAQRAEVFGRTVVSIKRNILSPPTIALPDGRFVRPVEVAAEILKKLKRDAEEGHFHEPVGRAVVTCPAEFNRVQRKKIEEAGRLAGFDEVALVEEPVAGALAYSRGGVNVGRRVLVYDLGGGTFDLAVLENEGERFRVAMEPKGMERCGGDDFDYALYYHCDGIARKDLGRPISPSGGVDLKFLRLCRRRKENLTYQERRTVSNYLSSDDGSSVRFEHEVDRATFEGLIDPYVETTARLTEAIIEEARAKGHEVDTVVLIGGSSSVPLVPKMLRETLPVNPLGFHKKDVAVALGAAYYADVRWPARQKEPPGPTPPPEPPPTLERYREVVEAVSDRPLNRERADRLGAYAAELRLGESEAAEAERRVLGDTREGVLRGRYRRAVEAVWSDGRLDGLELQWLGALAGELGLDGGEAERVEREVMGEQREAIFRDQVPEAAPPRDVFEAAVELAGHAEDVWTVALALDGKFLVSGGVGGEIKGWDAATGQLVGQLPGHPVAVSSAVFSPDGGLLATGGLDGTVKLWKLPNGELARAMDHADWVLSLAVSPNGKHVFSGGADGAVRVWEAGTGGLSRTLSGHSHWVLSLAVSPDGRTLVSGGADGNVVVWDLVTGEPLYAVEGAQRPVRFWSVACDHRGRLLAAAGEDGGIRIWDLGSGEPLRDLPGHPASVEAVVFTGSGELLSGGVEGRIKVWDPETGELLDVLAGHAGGTSALAVSPDGRLLVSGGHDRAVRVWRRGATRGGSRVARPDTLPDEPASGAAASELDQYREAVKNVYAATWGGLTRTWEGIGGAKDHLGGLVSRLRLRPEQAASIEREVMGDTREAVWRGERLAADEADPSARRRDRPGPDRPQSLPD